MKYKVSYICSHCGRKFANKLKCAEHESECQSRQYFKEKRIALLRELVLDFEKHDFNIILRYTTDSANFQIDVRDIKHF